MRTPQPLPVVLALTTLIDQLFDAIAARYGVFPIRGPVWLFIWKRLTQVKHRFARLAARFAAGRSFRARPARPRAARAPRRPCNREAARLKGWVTPDFGWLCRIAHGSIGAGAFAYGLRDLLTNDPEMRALLAATPATARALRPLCHMLGVPMPPPAVMDAVVVEARAPCAPEPESVAAADTTRSRDIVAIPGTIVALAPPEVAAPPPDRPPSAVQTAFLKAA